MALNPLQYQPDFDRYWRKFKELPGKKMINDRYYTLSRRSPWLSDVVAGVGFAPTSFSLWGWQSATDIPRHVKKGGGGDLRKCKKVPDNICNTTANTIWVGITTMADPARVELATHGFSVHCSTYWATGPYSIKYIVFPISYTAIIYHPHPIVNMWFPIFIEVSRQFCGHRVHKILVARSNI